MLPCALPDERAGYSALLVTARRDEAVRLRSQGVSWRKIAQVLDLPMSTVIRACSENLPTR